MTRNVCDVLLRRVGCAHRNGSKNGGHSSPYKILWTLIVVFATASLSAQVLDSEALRRKQDDQQRARTMTRDLLAGVLDLQLRQLEENGLEELPVYRDIKLMRGNLQHVVDAEMSKVVELLAAAQRQSLAEREQSFVEARKMIRTVVVRLSAERQGLLRRLKVAELAEQARRLIRMQTDVQAIVKSIPTEAQPRQEALLLKSREDQSDVKGLFFPLLETLDEVRTWGGPMAAVCQDGLRVLQAAEVGKHFDQAESELAAVRFASTVEHQDGVLKGLQELLKLLEKSQGAMAAENQALLDRLRTLAERQEASRAETRKLDPNEPTPTPLVEKQSNIQKDLGDLQRSLPINPTAERLLDQAEIAAKDATSHLFDGQHSKAVNEQGQVLGNLAALEELLVSGVNEAASDKTAAELVALVEELSSVQKTLEAAETKQDAAIEKAHGDAQAAAPLEREAVDKIAEAAKSAKLPEAIASQLKATEKVARSAQEALAQNAGPANDATQKLLSQAEDSLDRSQAAVEAALMDARRQAAAVKIGELARAAEALERAAAEERAIAAEAQALLNDATATEMSQQLADRQTDVAAIAQKVAGGLAETAPAVGDQVTESGKAIEQSQQSLTKAAQQPDSAAAMGQQAAKSALEAARQLAQAAKQLRAEVGDTAKALAQQSDRDAAAFADAREGVEGAMNDAIRSLSERMDRLQAAAAKTYEAGREQQRASGRPEAAQAMRLAEQIDELVDQQSAINAATNGATSMPVKAIAQQQAVVEAADAAREAAGRRAAAKGDPTKDALSQHLVRAQQKGKEATKAMLDGQSDVAHEARNEVTKSLRQAAALAIAEARTSMQSAPTASPDLSAERAAEAATKAAEELAVADAPAAAATLDGAAKSAAEAAQALAAQEPQRAMVPQQQTEKALATAQDQLQAARKKLAEEQAAMLAQQGNMADQLADRAARLDSSATEALDAATESASAAARPTEDELLSEAMQQALAKLAERQLEQAAATLGAKEQRIRRDQAVAEALTTVAEKQQSAAEVLDRLRQLAEAAMNAEQPTPEPNTAEAAQAAEDFAEAQRATGQGAVEISGQTEVANAMLRAALQMAAALPSARQAQPTPAMQGADGPMTPSSETSADASAKAQSSTDDDAPGELKPGEGQPGSKEGQAPADTGFVPQSPETTAKLMAGPQLTKAMQAAAEAAMPGEPNAQADAQPPQPNANATPGQNNAPPTKSASASQQGSQRGDEQKNPALKDDLAKSPDDKPDPKSSQPGSRQGDAESAALRRLQDEPWFAKLPPELRKSIGAGAQQKAPRAYEERLRKYFQSVD